MKKYFVILYIFLCITSFAQQNSTGKYALVIGNGAYTNLSRLANPVNDADDITAVLQELGFTVDKLLDATLVQMEEAVLRLRDRLHRSEEAYGFFFYAGHGVQMDGENFLIPVDANIPNETFLRHRALSVQLLLDNLNDAGNTLNVVVLDACRDNPFGWSRAGSRGLAMITRQPADSIIVYATSAGQVASDGTGRNGLFTSFFLEHLMDPTLEINEVLRRTGADVSEVSGGDQIPAIYSQFFRRAYLGGMPGAAQVPERTVRPYAPQPQTQKKTFTNPHLWSAGVSFGSALEAPWLISTIRGTVAPFENLFFGIGLDMGFISGEETVDKYHSLFPFVHIAYYRPLSKLGGFYFGTGGCYQFASYSFPEGTAAVNTFAFDFITGLNLLDIIDFSYTLRTNFEMFSSKISLGYIYRFK